MGPNLENRQTEAQTEQSALRSFRGVILPAVSRLGLSVTVFGASFLILILVVTSLIAPDRFPVHLKDRTVRLADLTEEQDRLESEYATLVAARTTLEQRVQAPILKQIDALQKDNMPLGAVLMKIDEVRKSFDVGSQAAIALPQVSFDAGKATLIIGGDVRDPQGRSVQLLASFVDGLRSIPLIQSVTEPEYRSDAIPSGGSVSPFTLSLTFHRAK